MSIPSSSGWSMAFPEYFQRPILCSGRRARSDPGCDVDGAGADDHVGAARDPIRFARGRCLPVGWEHWRLGAAIRVRLSGIIGGDLGWVGAHRAWVDKDQPLVVDVLARVEVGGPVEEADQGAALVPSNPTASESVPLVPGHRPHHVDLSGQFAFDPAYDVLVNVDRVRADLHDQVTVGCDGGGVAELVPRDRSRSCGR
jgi:hypothetical protein